MKFIKTKILLITCLVCLSPILLGVALWQSLPDTIAIHFDINNNPDNFAPKAFVVFGFPALMVLMQIFCCFVNDINSSKHGERKKFEMVTKWIIPVMSVILQTVTLYYSLGHELDIRRIVSLIVGLMLVITGNYLPKFDYIKNYDVDAEKARNINRFIGIETVVMGILFLTSTLFSAKATMACLFLMIPYVLIGVIYGIIKSRK